MFSCLYVSYANHANHASCDVLYCATLCYLNMLLAGKREKGKGPRGEESRYVNYKVSRSRASNIPDAFEAGKEYKTGPSHAMQLGKVFDFFR
jgi:hypothetical protein